MKKSKQDIFKLLLVIILIWIAFSVHNFSRNGRYQFDGDSTLIIDTRTGKTYRISPRTKKAVEVTQAIE